MYEKHEDHMYYGIGAGKEWIKPSIENDNDNDNEESITLVAWI